MGSMLATKVTDYMKDGLTGFVPTTPEEVDALKALGSGDVPKVSALPDTIRSLVESAYGHGIADVFVVAIPLAVLAIIAIAFVKNKPLSTKTAAEQLRDQAEKSAIGVAEAEVGATTATGAIRQQADAERGR